MRPFVTLALSSALVAPCAAMAQDLSSDIPPSPVLASLPGYAPLTEAPPPVTAPPAPTAEGVAPPVLEAPTDVAPVLVEAPEKTGLGKTVGTVAGGMAFGAVGAAVAGPVGKIAAGFLGKQLVRGLFGKKDTVQVQEVTPAADDAAKSAATKAPAPPMSTASAQ